MPEDTELTAPSPIEERIPVHPADKSGILIGPYGIRAGWSILIFLLILTAVMAVTLGGYGAYIGAKYGKHAAEHAPTVSAPGPKAPGSLLMSHGIVIAYLAPISLLMAFIERRRFGVYGFGGQHRVRDCIKGLITGFIALSLLVGILWSTHLLVFDGRLTFGTDALIYGLKWFAGFCLVGFTEEFMFRGYFQYTLMRGLSGILPAGNPYRRVFGFWAAAIALSGLFLYSHKGNPGETHVGLIAVFVVGMALAYSLWRTGSLWWAIGFHATWDFAQSFLYGVGDSGIFIQGRLFATHPQGNILWSGGPTGPEGSLYVLPIIALLAVVIRYTLPQRAQPPLIPEKWPIKLLEPIPPAEPV